MLKLQETFKLRIIKRFFSEKDLENFQADYNEHKSANTNNLKSKSVSDLDKNYLKDVIREVLNEKKNKKSKKKYKWRII